MKKILIIDDDPDAIAVFELLLSNYEIISITNPNYTIKTIKENSPDLIILDWIMPQKEGIDVLREIKSVTEIAEIPVILVSGIRTHSIHLSEALKTGSVDFIRKPIDGIELEARVMASIRMHDNLKENRQLQETIHANELEIAKAKTNYYQNELGKREREMIVSAISIFQNRKFLSTLKNEILEDLTEFNQLQKSQLFSILDRYENIANSFNWELFERRFIELSAGFYINLKTDYPTLTFGEQQICAFYKLGLTIREISILNYSSYEAVRKAVQRLRKKLNIDGKTDLSLFLQAY